MRAKVKRATKKKIPPDYIPFRMYEDGTVLFISPSMYKEAVKIVTASPDPQWVKDVAAAGAAVVAGEIAGGVAQSALMGAYVVKSLIDFDKKLDEQYRNDPTKQTYYATEVIDDEHAVIRRVSTIIDIAGKEFERSKERLGQSIGNLKKYYVCSKLFRYVGGILASRQTLCQESESEAFEKNASLKVLSYIKKVPGHIGSDGKKREWCIFSHETHKLLQCYPTKAEAEKALQRMHYYKNKKASFVFSPTGRVIAAFATEKEAKDFLARYLVYVNALSIALNLPFPEDVITYTGRVHRYFADVTPAQDDEMMVVSRLKLLTEFIETVLDWAKDSGVALEIQGSIFFYNPTEDAVKVIQDYRDGFNSTAGMMMTPAFSSDELEAYNISVETQDKKSAISPTVETAKSLLNVVTSVTIPDYSSFKLVLRDVDGQPAYEVTVPLITMRDLKQEVAHAH